MSCQSETHKQATEFSSACMFICAEIWLQHKTQLDSWILRNITWIRCTSVA